eukprot:TRINITY_DN20682_c0_g1_i1.p1 TRINITY_DN20682_c0_g1~~TRINITY_DN20682_c0_g1_i1.p1  ORF type:complete len:428 (+),score=37.79 TRINITY_DN20682_c0_g1_i1:90-1286(+)
MLVLALRYLQNRTLYDVVRAGLNEAAPAEHRESVLLDVESVLRNTSFFSPMASYLISFASMWVLIIVVFSNRGIVTCGAVLCYVTALSTMALVLKGVFHVWAFPLFVTSLHLLCTAIVAFLILLRRRRTEGEPMSFIDGHAFVKAICPVAVCFAGSIGLCNTGLSLSNVHFSEMVDSSTPIVGAVITLLMGKPFAPKLVPSLVLVVIGLFCCFYGEVGFSLLAFSFLMSGTILRSSKNVIQQVLMSENSVQTLTPIELVMYSSAASFAIMSLWSLYSEGLDPFWELVVSGTVPSKAKHMLLASIVNAIVINFASIYVIRDLGAVAQQLTGTLKSVLTVLGGVALREEMITWYQCIAYAAVVIGIVWYNQTDRMLKQGIDEKNKLEQPSSAYGTVQGKP